MTEGQANEADKKHSPLRLLVIGAVLTTIGSIVTAVVVSFINDEPGPSAPSEQAVSGGTTSGRTKAPAKATPMLDPSHRDRFVAEIGGDLAVASDVQINGDRFVYGAAGGVLVGCGIAYDDFIEFNLSRDYKKFRATVGLSDQTPQGGTRRILRLGRRQVALRARSSRSVRARRSPSTSPARCRVRFEVLGDHHYFGAIGDPTVE